MLLHHYFTCSLKRLVLFLLAQRWSCFQKKTTRYKSLPFYTQLYPYLSSFQEFWGAYYYKNNDNFIFASICHGLLLVLDSSRSKSIHSHSSRRTEAGKPISVLMYKKVRMKFVPFLQERPPPLGFDIKPIIYLWVNKLIAGLSFTRQGKSTRHSWWALLLVPKLS